ncbi:MAG: hypothetical protein J0L88_01765 [Xanthomonadales bacterium]|nr:hypothetical protein [Xanthomonadales bacterium]
MSRRSTARMRGNAEESRRRIAVEAARLIAEEGLRDYHDAKRKAAARLGAFDESTLPRNGEIEDALREHQRLFQSMSQPAHLERLRRAAIEAMRFLARFEPRLVGAVLEGTADAHSAVLVHLFSDDVREVIAFLAERRIPCEEATRTLRFAGDRELSLPALLVAADGVQVEFVVFDIDGLREAPLDRVDAKPMRRAGLAAVEALLRQE